MTKLRKILIANRGEIALRVVRACAEAGIESVAVFSEADRTSLHVRAADEAYPLGPPPSAESYLQGDRIIETALASGADAIHPGYGFLAENAAFAEKVLAAGLTWIGPPPNAMRLLGDKLTARKTVQAAGVPVVPGMDVALDDPALAAEAAATVGYPVLIKASAGGGGKGMRIVKSPEELASALRSAQSEATSSFGKGTIYLERYLEGVRHVEIQIMADEHGNVVHLGERECSIQRRYQKLIEEAPSVAVDADLRERMGAVAVAAARAAGYTSAGTVEFLLDKYRNFYFLEVNTRLQVEHPVTEMVTGLDLVLEQFRIASGRPMKFKQDEVRLSGHAIECRIAAEDPFNKFAPSLGNITAMAEPGGPGVRVDSSIYRGGRVSIYYDPMLAKLIVWAPTRAHAILRMRRALKEYRVVGIQTNIPFHLGVMQSIDFQRGRIDTGFVERFLGNSGRMQAEDTTQVADVAAMTAALVAARRHMDSVAASSNGQNSGNGKGLDEWRLSGRKGALR
jgi:acetyl-CoA carboxylase, biotin carboxylase subunit